jgi:hypothetical protein
VPEPYRLDPATHMPTGVNGCHLGGKGRSGRQEGEREGKVEPHGRSGWVVERKGVTRPSTDRQSGRCYFITSLIHPFVLLLSPLMIQLLLGYDSPTTVLSTAFPTSSSLVLIREASALMSR